MVPRQVLITIYKAFVRPHLDYGDVLYDQAFNNSFHAKIEFIQLRRWYSKPCLFYKVFKNEHPKYLFNLITVRSTPSATRTVDNISLIKPITHNPKVIKLIVRFRLSLSHLREHKFKHSFQDTINPLCQDIESTTHFFLHCPFFSNERRTLFSTIHSVDSKLLDFTDYDLTQT